MTPTNSQQSFSKQVSAPRDKNKAVLEREREREMNIVHVCVYVRVQGVSNYVGEIEQCL